MAISVKTFINPLNCEEPAYEVPVLYHPSSAGEICDGNGTTTNIYGDFANLADIATNSGTGNAANSDICQDGMDIVFVVDYTGSMGNAISGVKNGINNIVTEIQSQSNGNYRLGLVLFDGTSSQLQNGYVGQSDFYADLDPSQKINTGANVITCVEKMNTIGNQSTFATHLGYLDQPNGPTGMSIGAGTECGGVASYEVIQNSFAGQWRANVLKLIILITDDEPEETSTYFNNTLIPAADANNVQVFSNIAQYTSNNPQYPVNTLLYSSLSNGTTPAGQAYTGLDFTTNTWVNNMISGITTLCAETTTYTCDPAPAGWYTDAPLAAGATIHYWDGSAWVASHNCQYTVRVNLVDNITNGSVDDIGLNHANYYSIDTFEFTGPPNTQLSATIDCNADGGYANPINVNVSNVSDTNVITSTSVNATTDEVTITVTIPNQDELNHSIQINGSATQIQRTVRLDVINNTNDLTDSTGGTQAVGQVNVVQETPALGWLNVSNIYGEDAIRYTFTGVVGDAHAVDVNFLPNPSDYSINVNNVTASYFDLSGNTSSAINTLGQTAIGNLTLNGSAPYDYTGDLQIPAGDVWIKVFVNAQVNEPNYRYTLWVSENITGAQLQTGDNQHIFEGYTGEEFNFESLIENSAGYTGASATSVSLDTNIAFQDNGAITTGPTINSGNTGAEGVVTMPSGGGQGGIIISGQATQIVYSYVITIDSSAFSTAQWSTPVTLTGVAGSTPSVVVNSFNTAEYVYNLTGISSSEAGLTASISNATSMAILLDLEGGMPIGGGSATVTLTGTEALKTYSYDLSITTDNPVLGSFFVNPITLTGTAQQVLTGSFIFNEVANNTYSATGVTSNTFEASGTLGTGAADLFDVDYSVTMPSGGGSGELTITGASSTPTSYSYTVNYDNTQMSNGNNLTATPQAQNLSGSAGQVIPFTIDLDPSPSYYAISIQGTNNISTHDGSGSATSAPELVISGYNQTTNVISGDLTMPAGGGTGYVRPKGGVTNPSYTYDVTISIGGLGPGSNSQHVSVFGGSTHTFTGVTGSQDTHTFDLVADPGWTYVINSITDTGGSNVTGTDNNDDVDVAFTMPNGGGSATVNVVVTATEEIYYANMAWDEGNNIASAGAWDTGGNQFSGNLGDTFAIDNTWRIQNNTTFYSQSGINVAISGTDYPGKNPFSSLSSQTPTSGTSSRTAGTFTMPLGGGTWRFTIGGGTQTTLPTYTCTDFDNSFSINAGSTGSNLQYTWNNQPIPFGLNLTTNPTTYQHGAYMYTASFTVPSGYSNSGNNMSCNFSTTGTTTTTTKPRFECADAQLYINAGSVGDAVVINTSNKNNLFSIGQSNPTTYQNGTTTYFVDISISPTATQYSNAGGSLVCAVSGTGTTTTLPLFECGDTNIQIPNGAVGTNVLVNMNGIGTAQSVSPPTYQLGTQSYTVVVVPPSSGYSNSGGKAINCQASGTGTTTTTTTADPCLLCNDNLYLDVDLYTKGNGAGVANGALVAWKGGSDQCLFASSNVNLHYSATLNGSYTNLGSPNLYNYNENRVTPTTQTQIGGDQAPSYILGVSAGLDAGYYYITAIESQTGCTITSPTVHMEVENTTSTSSNKWHYLWGVDCSGDASESTNWFTASQTVRSHVLMVNPGTTLSTGNPNIASQYSFTNMTANDPLKPALMPSGSGYRFTRRHSDNTVHQYWGCTDVNVLRIKVDLNTAAGRAAFDSIGTNTAYQYTGTSLSFNSELDGKIKFCGVAVPVRSMGIDGNFFWDYNNGKAFRQPGTLHMTDPANNKPGVSNQIKEGNATANPAFTPSDWAICHGLTADCGFLEDPNPKDPSPVTTTTTSSGGGGGGGGDGENIKQDPGNEIQE